MDLGAGSRRRISSDDLGYTYGTYQISGDELAAKIIESGNYFRIWKKEKGPGRCFSI